MITRTIALLIAVSCALPGAEKQRDWKTGTVLDMETAQKDIDTGAMVQGAGPAMIDVQKTGYSVRSQAVVILGDMYAYAADRTTQYGILKHHACRFVVNEKVQFAQDRNVLYVRDVDGRECRMNIFYQERVKPK